MMRFQSVAPAPGRGSCAIVALGVALDMPYREVERLLTLCDVGDPDLASPAMKSPRDGTNIKTMHRFLAERGWTWTPTMKIGSGCRVHLRAGELPTGHTLIVRLSKHVCVVKDDVVYGTYDPSRGGSRCVYGYWMKATA